MNFRIIPKGSIRLPRKVAVWFLGKFHLDNILATLDHRGYVALPTGEFLNVFVNRIKDQQVKDGED